MYKDIFSGLFKSFERFIFRDFFYFISGFTILITVYLCELVPFDKLEPLVYLDTDRLNPLSMILFIAICYVVGYALQELFSLMHVVTTTYRKECRLKNKKKVNFLIGRLTRYFVGGKVKDYNVLLKEINIDCFYSCMDLHFYQEEKARCDRMINLMQLGSTMGPCFIVTGLIILTKFLMDGLKTQLWTKQLLLPFIILTFLGIVLILLNQIKALQYYKYALFIYEKRCKIYTDTTSVTTG